MRLREVLRMLGGSSAVYVIVAACSASGGDGFGVADSGVESGPTLQDAIADHTIGHDGAAHHDGAARDGARDGKSGRGILDALTDPVKEASADTNQSGTRLKTERYAATDGSSVFVGMYDSELKTECAFTANLDDGSTRCTPVGALTGTFFADSMCSTPLAAVPGCGAQPGYATVVTPATSCSSLATTQVFAVTGPWMGLVFSGSSGACAQASMTETAPFSFYSLATTETPPSKFVAGTFTVDF